MKKYLASQVFKAAAKEILGARLSCTSTLEFKLDGEGHIFVDAHGNAWVNGMLIQYSNLVARANVHNNLSLIAHIARRRSVRLSDVRTRHDQLEVDGDGSHLEFVLEEDGELVADIPLKKANAQRAAFELRDQICEYLEFREVRQEDIHVEFDEDSRTWKLIIEDQAHPLAAPLALRIHHPYRAGSNIQSRVVATNILEQPMRYVGRWLGISTSESRDWLYPAPDQLIESQGKTPAEWIGPQAGAIVEAGTEYASMLTCRHYSTEKSQYRLRGDGYDCELAEARFWKHRQVESWDALQYPFDDWLRMAILGSRDLAHVNRPSMKCLRDGLLLASDAIWQGRKPIVRTVALCACGNCIGHVHRELLEGSTCPATGEVANVAIDPHCNLPYSLFSEGMSEKRQVRECPVCADQVEPGDSDSTKRNWFLLPLAELELIERRRRAEIMRDLVTTIRADRQEIIDAARQQHETRRLVVNQVRQWNKTSRQFDALPEEEKAEASDRLMQAAGLQLFTCPRCSFSPTPESTWGRRRAVWKRYEHAHDTASFDNLETSEQFKSHEITPSTPEEQTSHETRQLFPVSKPILLRMAEMSEDDHELKEYVLDQYRCLDADVEENAGWVEPPAAYDVKHREVIRSLLVGLQRITDGDSDRIQWSIDWIDSLSDDDESNGNWDQLNADQQASAMRFIEDNLVDVFEEYYDDC